jgi:glycosyltransferase involved in cell wall biosynthesis
MTEWLLIAGDFTPLGGMDRANHALAAGLAASGARVHVVTHRAWPDISGNPSIVVHGVPRPLGSHFLGSSRLAKSAAHWAARLGSAARIVANGGNADTGDVNWVHYVHAAHEPVAAGWRRSLQARATHRFYLAREREALTRARVIICNSARTAGDVRQHFDVEPSRLPVVYYGSDESSRSPITREERDAARRDLGWPADRPVAVFIGALGDRRKGFDRVMAAWQILCLDARWDVDVAVVGAGSELGAWKRRADEARTGSHMRFLGFRDDVPRILAACDVLVHPARYEAYGLGVHEALCRGLPAIVSARAGIAELYPEDLRDWLIDDVEDARELADRVHRWRCDYETARGRVKPLSDRLRARTWGTMVEDFVRAAGV